MNKIFTLGIVLILSLTNIYGGTNDHAGQSINHAGQSIKHSSLGVGHIIAGSVKVIAGSIAIPFGIVGSIGEVSQQISKDFIDIATTPIGEPLKITDESIVSSVPPNIAIQQGDKK